MGGRGLGGLLAVAALSGCSLYFSDAQDDSPPDAGVPDAPDYTATLDIDVVVHAWRDGEYITAYLAEVDRPCTCAYGGFPGTPGTCASWTDVGGFCSCDPVPAACLHDLTIERGGQSAALIDDDFDPSVRGARIPGSGPSAVLHLRGCGAGTDLPVPIGPYPAPPALDDLHADASALHVSWSNGPPPIDALVSCGGGFSGGRCHEVDGQIDFELRCLDLGANTLAGAVPAQTGHGEIRIWQLSEGYYASLNHPTEEEPGRWSMGAQSRRVSVRTASGVQNLSVIRATFDVASQPLDTSVQFIATTDAASLTYTAGPVADVIEWAETPGRTCTGSVPHLVPAAPLELGDPYSPQTFTLTLPLTTLQCNIDGPKSVGFDLSWDLGIIVRPD